MEEALRRAAGAAGRRPDAAGAPPPPPPGPAGHTEVRRHRRLVLSFIATIANYEYGFYWSLHQVGGARQLVARFGRGLGRRAQALHHCRPEAAHRQASSLPGCTPTCLAALTPAPIRAQPAAQDGTIGFEVKLTGIVSTHALFPEERAAGGPQWGTLVAPGVNAFVHQHFFQVGLAEGWERRRGWGGGRGERFAQRLAAAA